MMLVYFPSPAALVAPCGAVRVTPSVVLVGRVMLRGVVVLCLGVLSRQQGQPMLLLWCLWLVVRP